MRREIWATLYHKLSTDEEPQHDKCPPGKDSWCKWQQAKATNKLAEFKHKSALPQMVFDAIKPIYESCCNAAVWNLALKSYSSGKKVLRVATDIAVCTFNDGLTNILRIIQVLEMNISYQAYNFCLETNATRITSSGL